MKKCSRCSHQVEDNTSSCPFCKCKKFVPPESRIKSSFYTEFICECNKIAEKYDTLYKKITHDELTPDKKVIADFEDLCNSKEKLLVNLEDKFVEEENEIENNKIDVPCNQFMFPNGDASQAYNFQLKAITRANNCLEIIADQRNSIETTEDEYRSIDKTCYDLFNSSVIIESDKNDDFLNFLVKFVNENPDKIKFTAIILQSSNAELLRKNISKGITLDSLWNKHKEFLENITFLKNENPNGYRKSCELELAAYENERKKFMKHFLFNPENSLIIKNDIDTKFIKWLSDFVKTKNYEVQLKVQLKCGEYYKDSGRINCELLSKELLNAGVKNFVCIDSKISLINEKFYGTFDIKKKSSNEIEFMRDTKKGTYYESEIKNERKQRIKDGIFLTFVIFAVLAVTFISTLGILLNMWAFLMPIIIGGGVISFLAFYLPYYKYIDKIYDEKISFLHKASSDYQKIISETRLSKVYKQILNEISTQRLQLEEYYNKHMEKADTLLIDLKSIYLRCLAKMKKYLSFLPTNFDYAIIPVIYKIMSTGEATDFKSACTLAKEEIDRNNELEVQRRYYQAVLSSQLKTEEYERQKANAQQEQAQFARQQAESARRSEEYAKQVADSFQHTEEYAKQQADSAKKQAESAEELLRRSNDPYYINKWKNS